MGLCCLTSTAPSLDLHHSVELSAVEREATLFVLVPGRHLDVVDDYLIWSVRLTTHDCGCVLRSLGCVVWFVLRAAASVGLIIAVKGCGGLHFLLDLVGRLMFQGVLFFLSAIVPVFNAVASLAFSFSANKYYLSIKNLQAIDSEQ